MNQDELNVLFDRHAETYDAQWAKTLPILTCLHLLLDAVFADVPADARVLCVGAGTGAELIHLAQHQPGWRFTVVEPSRAMIDICRRRAEAEGCADRCQFHAGYLDSLPAGAAHDAATCFLVSQFILEHDERVDFFRAIAGRLKPGGVLASSDLASDISSPEYEVLLRVWLSMMARADVPPDGIDRMRRAYAKDVGVLPPDRVASIIRSAGFDCPVVFFQAGLIHAWVSMRTPSRC